MSKVNGNGANGSGPLLEPLPTVEVTGMLCPFPVAQRFREANGKPKTTEPRFVHVDPVFTQLFAVKEERLNGDRSLRRWRVTRNTTADRVLEMLGSPQDNMIELGYLWQPMKGLLNGGSELLSGFEAWMCISEGRLLRAGETTLVRHPCLVGIGLCNSKKDVERCGAPITFAAAAGLADAPDLPVWLVKEGTLVIAA